MSDQAINTFLLAPQIYGDNPLFFIKDREVFFFAQFLLTLKGGEN